MITFKKGKTYKTVDVYLYFNLLEKDTKDVYTADMQHNLSQWYENNDIYHFLKPLHLFLSIFYL